MCCTRLAHNTGRKNLQKFVIWAPSHNLSGCIFAIKACIGNRKKVIKQQYVLHMSSQYGELRPISGWDRFTTLGTPANFNGFRVLASLLYRRRSMDVNQTLHDVWPSPGLVHYIFIFWGSWPLREFWQVQSSLCVQDLRSPILAALLHGTRAIGVSQTLRHGTRNWIQDLLYRAPSIFGRAAITLGIGPHSS